MLPIILYYMLLTFPPDSEHVMFPQSADVLSIFILKFNLLVLEYAHLLKKPV